LASFFKRFLIRVNSSIKTRVFAAHENAMLSETGESFLLIKADAVALIERKRLSAAEVEAIVWSV